MNYSISLSLFALLACSACVSDSGFTTSSRGGSLPVACECNCPYQPTTPGVIRPSAPVPSVDLDRYYAPTIPTAPSLYYPYSAPTHQPPFRAEPSPVRPTYQDNDFDYYRDY